jgi:hypothetical protein
MAPRKTFPDLMIFEGGPFSEARVAAPKHCFAARDAEDLVIDNFRSGILKMSIIVSIQVIRARDGERYRWPGTGRCTDANTLN